MRHLFEPDGRHTSMRGRLAMMIIAIMVMPLSVLGLMGLGYFDEQAHAADADWTATVGKQISLRIRHVEDRLESRMKAIALEVALRLDGTDAGEAPGTGDRLLDEWGLSGRLDHLVRVADDVVALPGADRETVRAIRALVERPGRVGYLSLVVGDDAPPALHQGLAMPHRDGASLVLLRRLDDARLRGLHVESAARLLFTLGDRVVAYSPSRRGGLDEDRPRRIALDDWSAVAREPQVWIGTEGTQSTAAVPLRHPDGTAIGAVWMTSDVSTDRRSDSLLGRARALLGLLAMGGVVMAIGVGWVAPQWVARGIRGSTDRMYASVRRLRELGARNARGIHEQTRVIGGLVDTFEDLGASSRAISSTATELSQLADQSSHVTRRGEGTVRVAADATGRVRQRVAHVSEHIGHLGQQAVAMRSILDLLQNLTNETNRLSIDATIEASEAGESGRRFRLIAEEIGKLADQGLQSTRVIASRIDMVTESTQMTLDASRTGSQEVDNALQSFAQLEQTFELILSWVEETMNAARDIERRTSEQAQSLDAVAESIEELRHRARDTETNFRDIAEAIDELAELADDMNTQWKVG